MEEEVFGDIYRNAMIFWNMIEAFGCENDSRERDISDPFWKLWDSGWSDPKKRVWWLLKRLDQWSQDSNSIDYEYAIDIIEEIEKIVEKFTKSIKFSHPYNILLELFYEYVKDYCSHISDSINENLNLSKIHEIRHLDWYDFNDINEMITCSTDSCPEMEYTLKNPEDILDGKGESMKFYYGTLILLLKYLFDLSSESFTQQFESLYIFNNPELEKVLNLEKTVSRLEFGEAYSFFKEVMEKNPSIISERIIENFIWDVNLGVLEKIYVKAIDKQMAELLFWRDRLEECEKNKNVNEDRWVLYSGVNKIMIERKKFITYLLFKLENLASITNADLVLE